MYANFPLKGPAQVMTWLLLATAIVAGGGHAVSPFPTIIIEVLGAFTLALIVAARGEVLLMKGARLPLALLIFMFAVPLLQLVPLPPAIYGQLPGRSLIHQAVELTGVSRSSFPFTLSPDDTLGCALALLPSVGIFVATIALPPGSEKILARIVIGAAAASAVLAAVQAAGGAHSPLYLYETTIKGVPTGFFGNRNHQPDLMTAGVLFASALTARAFGQRDFRLLDFMIAAAVPILIIANVSTFSRTGSALLLPSLLVALLLFRGQTKRALSPSLFAALGILIGIALAAYFLAPLVLHRFGRFSEDDRFVIWPDAIYAIRQFAPFGSGLGTFKLVFNAIERLATVQPNYVNNAHNDYLELILETGVIGAAGIASFIGWFVWAAVRVWKRKAVGSLDLLARASTGVVTVFLVHSIFDYPLRAKALAVVFAFACGLIVRSNMYAPIGRPALARRLGDDPQGLTETSSIQVVPPEMSPPAAATSSSFWDPQPGGTEKL